MGRIDKVNYYLNIAEAVSQRSSCLRRQYGAIIVKDDEIISTGYNGAPRGCGNCVDKGFCLRQELNIPQGERYDLCESVHAEANAIISADRKSMLGSTLFLVGRNKGSLIDAEPCKMCSKLIINAGISRVISRYPSLPEGVYTMYRDKMVALSNFIYNDFRLLEEING